MEFFNLIWAFLFDEKSRKLTQYVPNTVDIKKLGLLLGFKENEFVNEISKYICNNNIIWQRCKLYTAVPPTSPQNDMSDTFEEEV